MKQFMAVLVFIASIVFMSCAGASGGDDGAVNGYIPLVGGNLPNELAPRRISFSSGLNPFCMIGFTITNDSLGDYTGGADNIYNFVTSAPVVSGWSGVSEPVSDNDKFTYNYLGTIITLTAHVTDITNEETGEIGNKITYTSNIFNPQIDSDFDKNKYESTVIVSFDMTTNTIVSDQTVFFKAESSNDFEKHGKTVTHMDGTWSDTLYSMHGTRDEWVAYDDRNTNSSIPGSGRLKFIDFVDGNTNALTQNQYYIEYKKTPSFTGVKRTGGIAEVCWYYFDDPAIQVDNSSLDVWNSH